MRKGSFLQTLRACSIQFYENVNLFPKVWFSLLCRRTYLKEHHWYCNINSKRYQSFVMNRIMESKESSRAHFIWLSQFHFLHFLRCYITVFYNNKYIIISSLTNGVTDIGVFLSKAVRKDYKAQERNYIESVSLISST